MRINNFLMLISVFIITLYSCTNAASGSSEGSSSTAFSLPQVEVSPLAAGDVPVPSVSSPFVDNYKTNLTANTTEATNAALSLLSGMNKLWTPGTAWNNGIVLNTVVLSGNVQYVAGVTTTRTSAQETEAYLDDRRNQSYSIISGLGLLYSYYIAGTGATTTITEVASDATTVKYNDNGTGAGTSTSSLADIVNLVGTLRGNYSSTNPSKSYFLYPRPWRLNDSSSIVDTGATDSLGFPVYATNVVLLPTLAPARSTTPATDGGFPSGHTNAGYLAAFALAYAIPERYQELLTRASDLGNNRIIAGMHSPLDVIGGRIIATALAASILSDSNNSTLKSLAYSTAHTYLEAQTGTNDNTLNTFAHSGTSSNDSYYDHDVNETKYNERLTYGFSQIETSTPAATVPKGAEALLETRFPYLDAAQRRWVLLSTSIDSGYPLLNDNEGWGRLNLFDAADGYGYFSGNIIVSMDSSKGGFNAVDTWKNNISGTGKLYKQGTGTLILTGSNSYSGGTQIDGGTLQLDSVNAFGSGNVVLNGGTLVSNAKGILALNGGYNQLSTSTLTLNLSESSKGIISIKGNAGFAGTLNVNFTGTYTPSIGDSIKIITAGNVAGTFSTINVQGFKVTPSYTSTGLELKIVSTI